MVLEVGLVKTQPDPYKAIYAIQTAAEMLKNADDAAAGNDLDSAYEYALNAMRLSSSALLFLDGYVAQTLGAATRYMRERYKQVPTDEWRIAEERDPRRRGVLEGLLEAVGMRKRDDKIDTMKTIAVAKVFVASALALIETDSNIEPFETEEGASLIDWRYM